MPDITTCTQCSRCLAIAQILDPPEKFYLVSQTDGHKVIYCEKCLAEIATSRYPLNRNVTEIEWTK